MMALLAAALSSTAARIRWTVRPSSNDGEGWLPLPIATRKSHG
jgi:hypothetical protein